VGVDWIKLSEDNVQWQTVVKTTVTFEFLNISEEFANYLSNRFS